MPPLLLTFVFDVARMEFSEFGTKPFADKRGFKKTCFLGGSFSRSVKAEAFHRRVRETPRFAVAEESVVSLFDHVWSYRLSALRSRPTG